jgi:uncharacterized protein with FMN-binding domain
MRRAPLVLTATAAGLAGVLAYHTQRPPSTLAAGNPTTTTSGPATGSRHHGGGRSSRSAGGHASGSHASSPGTSSRSSGTGTRGGTRSATGPVEQYGYGELSVRVSATGGRITSVQLATLSTAESYSQQLADQVVGTLAGQVVAAQSGHIQGVSGATYTSEAYAISAQAAIDALRR